MKSEYQKGFIDGMNFGVKSTLEYTKDQLKELLALADKLPDMIKEAIDKKKDEYDNA